MDDWYYKRADTEFGPISDAELRALLEREKNAGEIEIRRNASEEWVSAVMAQPIAQSPPSVPPPLPPLIPNPQPTPPARAISGPTGWLWFSAMLLSLDLIVLGFMQIVFIMYALFLLAGVTGLPDWFTKCVDAFDSRLIGPQLMMFALLVLWQGCAFGSIRRLYPGVRIEHGRGSGFWWITPVANLFMPFICLRELRWASKQLRKDREVGFTTGVVIWMILIVFILRICAAIADALIKVAKTTNTGITEEGTTTLSNVANLAFHFFGLTLSLLLIVFVLRNLIQQIRLYREWNKTPAAAL